MNYEFDLEEWLPHFPLRERHGHYTGDSITSPCQLCNNEWLRRGLIEEYDWCEPVPVDIFIMSKGEPADRSATKIGGLPYRSASVPWPRNATGNAYTLIAQFNFTQSFDIIGNLPGDLLLIFGDESKGLSGPLHLEWQHIGLENLIQTAQVPSECIKIEPCFGNRCRMMSYPDAVRKTTSKYPLCDGKAVWSSRMLPQLQATQIGRAPLFIQKGDRLLPGQPLCTISSTQPDLYQPYPWVNVREPLYGEGVFPHQGDGLMIGDVGCIYIFIEKDGTLHARASCY